MGTFNMASRCMRRKDAAQYLGVSATTFWRLVKAGKLPQGINISKHCVVWFREDLDRFLEEAAQN